MMRKDGKSNPHSRGLAGNRREEEVTMTVTGKKEKNVNPAGSGRPDIKKLRRAGWIWGIIGVAIVLFISFYLCLVPLNMHSVGLWMTLILATLVYGLIQLMVFGIGCSPWNHVVLEGGRTGDELTARKARLLLIPAGLALLTLIIGISGAAMFHADRYASILQPQEAEFSQDLSEAVGTDSIALMDTASAKMLGDREIGSLGNVVSQYDVSDDYIQIDLEGTPKKVAALDYAGFFKWINNKENGVPGYVVVDPVSMSASYQQCEEAMIYVPSAYFSQDAARYIRMHYPTVMFGNLHFEINEEGRPYYIASVYEKTISLFGGKTVSGCIVLDPVTGDLQQYALADTPTWIDVVYDGDLICQQYNWYGKLQNGFWNSIFGKKGCKQVTTYVASDEEDDAPASDYGYVAKDGDIWIYTGITSVNNDSSNIGFLLSNERTGESHYFNISGADEKSAMAAAEGEVQEKGYQASFPSLINVEGNPTYIMVLKDASGLVKLYAAVNVQQYNLVTTAATQAECMAKYRQLLGIDDGDGDMLPPETDQTDAPPEATDEAEIRIQDIRYIDIDGNTYIYLIDGNENLYRAMVKNHEEMLLLAAGDQVRITYNGREIVTCELVR